MNLPELLAFVLMITLAVIGGKYAGAYFGIIGYVGGFLAGGAVVPLVLWRLGKIFPPPRPPGQ